MESSSLSRPIRFGVYEADLRTGELRKNGLKLKLGGQPFQVLAMLLERQGDVVTREELQKRLWPADTFVDFDHSLNTAINKIREALGDSADNPRYVETLPRRGYRFIAPVEPLTPGLSPADRGWPAGAGEGPAGAGAVREVPLQDRRRWPIFAAAILGVAMLTAAASLFYRRTHQPISPAQRALTRLTFDAGLQFGATWSPDGRFIAYSSDKGGKFDIWVQPVASGDAVQVTKGPGQNWQPDWSPDGKQIVFRSERGDGGLYVVPALGGMETKAASFRYYPRWSPNGSKILFQTTFLRQVGESKLFDVSMDGNPPREVLADFFRESGITSASVAWHPDGKRISLWVSDLTFSFWTVPLAGGPPIKSECSQAVQDQLAGLSRLYGVMNFTWAPSGRAIYFEGTSHGVRNLWKVAVDPQTVGIVGEAERLTTGPGPDTDVSLSPDGKKLAFVARGERTRIWSFPFDAAIGRIRGEGEPLTPSGVDAWMPELSRDGKKMVFTVERAGKSEIWQKSLQDGKETLLAADDFVRWDPHWSPDGTRVVYLRFDPRTQEGRLTLRSSEGNEEPLTSHFECFPWDWSADGQWVLTSRPRSGPFCSEAAIWKLPLSAAPRAETAGRLVTSGPSHSLYQARFSPDGRWIAFEAVNVPGSTGSTIYVLPASGGPWTRITDGKQWDDKPRWSPDGRTIYYVSNRSGFFNVWGIHLDPVEGRPLGEPFQVTKLGSPGRLIPDRTADLEISLVENRLALPVTEVSGSIWMLDNVDK